MKKKMRMMACLLSLAMLTGSIVTGTVAADTTAETETIAVDAEAEFLPVAVYVQLSAEHAAQLDAFRQEFEAFRDKWEADLVPLSEAENEAYDRFVKGEISQEEYTAISKKNQPLIDAIADQVGEAYFKFNADARNLAESEAADKMAAWGITSGLAFANVYTDIAGYCLCGEVTAAQAEMLRNDPAVAAVEEFEPLETPPAEPDTAEPVIIETDAFSYSCYTPLSNIRNYINSRDVLTIPDTKANFMVTGIFQDKSSGSIVYTTIELNTKYGAYRGTIEYWDNVPGNVPLHAGDLLYLTGYAPIEPYPPEYPCGEGTEFEVIGNGCDLLGKEFAKVIKHENDLAGYYALGYSVNYTDYYTQLDTVEVFDPVEIIRAYSGLTYSVFGDPNNDGVVNASDAAAVLIEAAAVGAGMDASFTEGQLFIADVNKDNTINASDAAILLVYASAVGAGDMYAKISDFVKT